MSPSRIFQYILTVVISISSFAQPVSQPAPAATTPEAADLVAAGESVRTLAGGFKFLEGPVWFDDAVEPGGGHLIFSDIPASTLHRWNETAGVSVFRADSNGTNGNTRDLDGNLVSCEQSIHAVTTTIDARRAVLVDRHQGKRFNSPNDVVVKSDGTVWFTDPTYGLPKGRLREIDKQCVFRFDPKTQSTTVVIDDMHMPNGLCFSPDESKLYVADSGSKGLKNVKAFDVQPDGTLKNGTSFATLDQTRKAGAPDGIRVDVTGRLYVTAGDGVQIFTPEGKPLGAILTPESPANICFGGPDRKTLFITARTSLYAVRLTVAGK